MLNPFKSKQQQTTTVDPEGDVLPPEPDVRTLRLQKIQEYSDPLTDMYTEKRNHMYACIEEFEKTLTKRNEVYVKLMDGKKYIPDLPNIKAYFEDLDKRFKELTITLEELRLSCISAVEDCEELYLRLTGMKYRYIHSRLVTENEFYLEQKDYIHEGVIGSHIRFSAIESGENYERNTFKEQLNRFENFI